MSNAFHLRQRGLAHSRIMRYGTAAILRREGGDRACMVIEDSYTPEEPRGGSAQTLPRFYLVSSLTAEGAELSPPPDSHEDRLVVLEEELIITRPVGRLTANGSDIIYYELTCEKP